MGKLTTQEPTAAQPNGILVVDKPAGFTSFDVVAKLRGICGTRKIGHGGTLDPMATGVLPVFVGPAVKAVDLAPNQDKGYEAGVLLGLRTDTGDVTGSVLARDDARPTLGQLQAVLPRFIGAQLQMPPMYSAIKINGVPLYKYARAGKQVERKPRPVTIHSLEYIEAIQAGAPAAANAPLERFGLRVLCGKGTYVRTLVEDIAEALGMMATLETLRRTSAGVFKLAQAHTLNEIQAAKDAGRLQVLYTPVDAVFAMLPKAALDAAAATRLRNGATVYGAQVAAGRYRAYVDSAFLGLVTVDAQGLLRGEKLF